MGARELLPGTLDRQPDRSPLVLDAIPCPVPWGLCAGGNLPEVARGAPSPEVNSLRSGLFRSASLWLSGCTASDHKEGHKMTTKNNHPELLEQLTEGIANLTTSDEWQRYLDCQSRFYSYSSNNVMLIAQQAHEATRVAGFNAWRRRTGLSARERRPSGFSPPWSTSKLTRRLKKSEGDPRLQMGTSVRHRLHGRRGSSDYLSPGLRRRSCWNLRPPHEFATSIGFTVEEHEFAAASTATALTALHRIRVEIPTHPHSE